VARPPESFTGLTSDDLAAIREETQAAEARTGGELVCVLVRRCDAYEGVPWKGAALGAIVGVLMATLWQVLGAAWAPPNNFLYALATLLGAALGFFGVLTLPTVARLLIPPDVLDRRVDRRAAAAFLEEEIFDTRDRTGVLVFVAFFEHRVRILADTGIQERVDPSLWPAIAGELTRGLRAGRAREALLTAIKACGEALEAAVERRDDDLNELSDEPRVHDD